MGMRRLSIIDLAGGGQPIYNEDHSVAVCFNGEIYNYVELMAELEEKGHRFRTHSDTEVIVHAYEQWGEECVERLNGMFAFALYDKGREELFVARDRTGQKPLLLLAGRRAPGVRLRDQGDPRVRGRAAPGEPARDRRLPGAPLRAAARDALRGHPRAPRRPLAAAAQAAGSSCAATGTCRMYEGPYRSAAEYQEEFEELFLDAVRLTLRSDVPVGAYLSGGIDSSLVVAAITRFKDKLKTFSIGFRSPIDETHEAAALAKQLGTEHHEIHLLPEHFAELPKALWHLERPIGDALILAYYQLARETSKHLKVVLSGEGADESYAGYSFHKIILWSERYKRLVPRALNRGLVAPALAAIPVPLLDKLFVYPAYLGQVGKAKTVDYLRNYHDRDLAQNYASLKALWDLPERERLYAPALRAQAGEAWLHHSRMEGGPFLDRLLQLQFDDWLQDNLLLRQDKNTMAWSLELRCPFLDHRVIEQAFRMPSRMKVRGLRDKWVERELGRKWLPPENVKRSKNPFYLPLEYFHEHPELRDLIRMTLESRAGGPAGLVRPGLRGLARRAHGDRRVPVLEAGAFARHP